MRFEKINTRRNALYQGNDLALMIFYETPKIMLKVNEIMEKFQAVSTMVVFLNNVYAQEELR